MSENKQFIGVAALLKWVSVLALQITSDHHNDELNKIAEQLDLLDAGLKRLRYDRDFVDVEDVNRCIDALRGE